MILAYEKIRKEVEATLANIMEHCENYSQLHYEDMFEDVLTALAADVGDEGALHMANYIRYLFLTLTHVTHT